MNASLVRVDREWEKERSLYLAPRRMGLSLPQGLLPLLGGVVAIAMGLLGVALAAMLNGAVGRLRLLRHPKYGDHFSGDLLFFSLFGLVLVGFGIVALANGLPQILAYVRAKAAYQRRRMEVPADKR